MAACQVTPFVGVWIETSPLLSLMRIGCVTPFVGVWIETCVDMQYKDSRESHPSWVCGLKHFHIFAGRTLKQVTPFVGVWIETKKEVTVT